MFVPAADTAPQTKILCFGALLPVSGFYLKWVAAGELLSVSESYWGNFTFTKLAPQAIFPVSQGISPYRKSAAGEKIRFQDATKEILCLTAEGM